VKWFLDANVVLDALLRRTPHAADSAAVWMAVETHAVDGIVAAHSVTTIYYLIRKQHGDAVGRRAVSRLLRVFNIALVDGAVIERALALAWPDFEDAVSAASAERAGCDMIVTRDPKGFRSSLIPVHTPETARAILSRQ
jgi:predicted nucleic acid-binding protein